MKYNIGKEVGIYANSGVWVKVLDDTRDEVLIGYGSGIYHELYSKVFSEVWDETNSEIRNKIISTI